MHSKHKGSLKDSKDILCQEKKIGDIGQCQWYNSTFQVDSNMSFTVNIVYKNFNISNLLMISSRLTLLLGPPSSGKTTLLMALAGRLKSGLQV